MTAPMRQRRTAATAAALTGVLLSFGATPSWAVTFTVNSDSDAADADLTDEVCDTNLRPLPAGLQCTLRAALEESNDEPSDDDIHFNLPASSDKTISPLEALPAIAGDLTIDGYTQPGAAPNTSARGNNAELVVQLEGKTSDDAGRFISGLTVVNNSSTIRGLVINRFRDYGIRVIGGENSKVTGNFIGTNRAGTRALGNTDGVQLGGHQSELGGDQPSERNLVSGNEFIGVEVGGSGEADVFGNFIGTEADGLSPLGNGVRGITVTTGDDHEIGGSSAASANVVAHNGVTNGAGDGLVVLQGDDGALIGRNSIFANADRGIDIYSDGLTPNDGTAEADGAQNFPELLSAVRRNERTVIKGAIQTLPATAIKLHFYRNPAGPAEDAQAKTFLGTKTVTTGAAGQASFTFRTPTRLRRNENITATATGSETSEISPPVKVVEVG